MARNHSQKKRHTNYRTKAPQRKPTTSNSAQQTLSTRPIPVHDNPSKTTSQYTSTSIHYAFGHSGVKHYTSRLGESNIKAPTGKWVRSCWGSTLTTQAARNQVVSPTSSAYGGLMHDAGWQLKTTKRDLKKKKKKAGSRIWLGKKLPTSHQHHHS